MQELAMILSFCRKYSFLFFILIITTAVAANILEDRANLNNQDLQFTELYRVKINNLENGTILASQDKGSSWQLIGNVLKPVTAVNKKGFSASRYGEIGKITAVAVNALHIKTGQDQAEDRGIIFSIMPSKIKTKEVFYNSKSTLLTDLLPKSGLFGGPYTPLVGNPVYLEKTDGSLVFLPPNYQPKINDRLVIIVLCPTPYPKEIHFENKFGGKITITYKNGIKRVIGQVLKPVSGVGRFIGSQYSGLSRVRANHSGVIDISTSLGKGKVGGFQIIPSHHSMDPEMTKTRLSTQWMVVGPYNPDEADLAGLAPLFSQFIFPKYSEADLEDKNWQLSLSNRTLVQIKEKGDLAWQILPAFNFRADKPLPDSANSALKDVTEIKILLPSMLAQ